MNLHEDKRLFAEIILRASQPVENGGLGINANFIEKDYWITRSLQLLSRSTAKDCAVFKGGTSLSKIYGIGARFSEDVDVAIIHTDDMSDARLKTTIRSVAKSMSEGLEEMNRPGLTSKGSRYRKSYFQYPRIEGILPIGSLLPGQLLIEINSFANPFPFALQPVDSFVKQYLVANKLDDIISDYDMGDFEINVLDKRTTLTEKLVSLIRFSLSENPLQDISAKIRHFYDLHFLLQDVECVKYINTDLFINDFNELLQHDRCQFAKPDGWQHRNISESVLITNWSEMWKRLSTKYQEELPPLAYRQIPSPKAIEGSITTLLSRIV